MRVDLVLQQARRVEKRRREHMWCVVTAVAGSLATGSAGLIFALAMGLHDARWSDAWVQVGDASSPFSTPVVNGVGRNGALHNG